MAESSDEPDMLWWAKLIGKVVWACRLIRLQGLVWRAREAATIGVLRPLHFNVLHRAQRLAAEYPVRDVELATASTLALQICTECRKLMGTFLELPDNKLHCCFKLMAPKVPENSDDLVATWVRSEPFDTRPAEDKIEHAHAVSRNTVWSAILGGYDGKTTWERFRSFSCNDLTSHPDFRCDRKDWHRYYRSTFVVPIRYPANKLGTEHNHFGFVAFDSPVKCAFRGLPDIFKYREDPIGYSDRLESCGAFHLAAILADVIGSFLGPTMNRKGCVT
jgi:hypothetical protein